MLCQSATWKLSYAFFSSHHSILNQHLGLDKNGWDANIAGKASHSSPWKFISYGYTAFKSLLSLKVGNGSRFNFWEDHWAGDSFFILGFPCLYRLSSLHNCPIQNFYNVHDSTYSWNFTFFLILNDRESFELAGLLGLFDFLLLSSSPDESLWSLDPSRMFTCKSYFQFLTYSLTHTSLLLDKPIWKSKDPSKVKSFICTVVLNRINTNDML